MRNPATVNILRPFKDLRRKCKSKSLQLMGRELAGWQVSCGIAVPLLANGTVLFDQPDLARIPYLSRVWGEITGPVFALILIGVIFALTRDRDKSLAIS